MPAYASLISTLQGTDPDMRVDRENAPLKRKLEADYHDNAPNKRSSRDGSQASSHSSYYTQRGRQPLTQAQNGSISSISSYSSSGSGSHRRKRHSSSKIRDHSRSRSPSRNLVIAREDSNLPLDYVSSPPLHPEQPENPQQHFSSRLSSFSSGYEQPDSVDVDMDQSQPPPHASMALSEYSCSYVQEDESYSVVESHHGNQDGGDLMDVKEESESEYGVPDMAKVKSEPPSTPRLGNMSNPLASEYSAHSERAPQSSTDGSDSYEHETDPLFCDVGQDAGESVAKDAEHVEQLVVKTESDEINEEIKFRKSISKLECLPLYLIVSSSRTRDNSRNPQH